jgi:hypothetical protein
MKMSVRHTINPGHFVNAIQQQQAFLSQTSWGRLEMKPTRPNTKIPTKVKEDGKGRGRKKGERKRAIDYQERIKKVKLKEIEMAHVEKRQSCTLSIVSLSDKILASQTRD